MAKPIMLLIPVALAAPQISMARSVSILCGRGVKHVFLEEGQSRPDMIAHPPDNDNAIRRPYFYSFDNSGARGRVFYYCFYDESAFLKFNRDWNLIDNLKDKGPSRIRYGVIPDNMKKCVFGLNGTFWCQTKPLA